MNWRLEIELNPNVLVNKPLVNATRLSVELIPPMIAAGASESEILGIYSSLEVKKLKAWTGYAAKDLMAPRSSANLPGADIDETSSQ